MFNSPPNPYIVGNPLTDPNGFGFYGRQDVYNFLQDNLNAVRRPAILLHGHRRIGKTSILRQVPRFLPSDFKTVFIDIQGQAYEPFDKLLSGMAYELNESIGGIEGFKDEIVTPEYFYSHFLPKIFEKLDGNKRRLVLLFDEFDALDPQADNADNVRQFLNFLRTLMINEQEVGYIFVVGQRVEKLHKIFREIADKVYPLGRLSREETETLIRKPAEGILSYPDDTIERIWYLTAGHPLFTQLICFELWSQYANQGSVPPEAVDKLIPDFLRAGDNQLNQTYDVQEKPIYQFFLSAVAEHSQPGEPVELEVIQNSLQHQQVDIRPFLDDIKSDLVKWDILGEEPKNYFYFTVELVRQWVVTRRPLESMASKAIQINKRAFKFYEHAENLRLSIKSEPHDDQDQINAKPQRRNELQEALVNYGRALQLNEYFTDAIAGKSRVALEMGDIELAVSEGKNAFESDPKYWRVYRNSLMNLAQKHEARNELEAAVKTYELVLEYRSEDDQALASRNRLLIRQGKTLRENNCFPEAIKLFDKAGASKLVTETKAIWDSKWHELTSKVDECRESNEWEQALEQIDVYEMHFPFDERTAELKQQSLREAKEWWFNKGESLFNKDKPDQALAFFQKAEANPQIELVRKALVKIDVGRVDPWRNVSHVVRNMIPLIIYPVLLIYLLKFTVRSEVEFLVLKTLTAGLLFLLLRIIIKDMIVMPVSIFFWYDSKKLLQADEKERPILLHNATYRRSTYSSALSLALTTIVLEYFIRTEYNLNVTWISILIAGSIGFFWAIIAFRPVTVLENHYSKIHQVRPNFDLFMYFLMVPIPMYGISLSIPNYYDTIYYSLGTIIAFGFGLFAFVTIRAFIRDFD